MRGHGPSVFKNGEHVPPPRKLARLFAFCGLPVAALAATAAPVDFRQEVLPILSDACFRCHGPDEAKREAHLRLDTKEGLYRTREGFTVVKPGKPAESEIVLRTSSEDPDEVMPPHDAVRRLTTAEIATLKRWVAEGAPWSKHWSFTPVAKVKPPAIREKKIFPIDAFVRARLRPEQLTPAPEADRERLLRRITLDLTGPAADSGRERCVSGRSFVTGLRNGRRPTARLAAFR